MTPFRRFALRDLTLLLVTLSTWALLARIGNTGGWLGDAVGVALGGMAGACAWFAHEWGHLFAALAMRARVRPPKSLVHPYLFGFRNSENTKAQFIAMSLGGFAATAMMFWLAAFVLPQDWLAVRVMRSLILLEIAVTVALEVPGLLLGTVAYSKLPSVDVLD